MTAPPIAIAGQRVVGEPRRLRHEIAWTLELPDGRRAVLAQLVAELAADVALRRRWVVDMERVAAQPVARLAPTLAIGPRPDPRAPEAEPPWRVRLDPPGQALDARLCRAPLPGLAGDRPAGAAFAPRDEIAARIATAIGAPTALPSCRLVIW